MTPYFLTTIVLTLCFATLMAIWHMRQSREDQAYRNLRELSKHLHEIADK